MPGLAGPGAKNGRLALYFWQYTVQFYIIYLYTAPHRGTSSAETRCLEDGTLEPAKNLESKAWVRCVTAGSKAAHAVSGAFCRREAGYESHSQLLHAGWEYCNPKVPEITWTDVYTVACVPYRAWAKLVTRSRGTHLRCCGTTWCAALSAESSSSLRLLTSCNFHSG